MAYLYAATAMFLSRPVYAAGTVIGVIALAVLASYLADRRARRRVAARVLPPRIVLPAQRTSPESRPAPGRRDPA